MSQKLVVSLVALFVLTCAAPALADTVTASGAGPLPSSAQDLTGINVTQIVGGLGALEFPLGVDMFKINITDASDFSAITTPVSFGVPDTELFLFDATGLGVYGNDDSSGSNTLSCLPSADSSNPCLSTRPTGVGPVTDGTYYLAITRSANGPLDGSNNEIFSPVLSTDVVGPNSGTGAITGWDNNVFTSPDFGLTAFDITLTGTSPIATPEPATWALIATGIVFILLRRRQLTPQ